MQDGRDDRIYTDENGERWLTDESGKVLKDERGGNIPPSQAMRNSEDGEFTTYDTSQGHCGLCGRIGCHGECFR